MVAHRFYKGMGATPDLELVDQPAWIGDYPQPVNSPLYFLQGAVPLAIINWREASTRSCTPCA